MIVGLNTNISGTDLTMPKSLLALSGPHANAGNPL